MKLAYLKIVKYREAISVKTVATIAIVMVTLLILCNALGFLTQLHTTVGLPIDFKVRELLEVTPPVNPKLKIVILDDSTYAFLRKPYLTGDDWSELLKAVGSAQPRAIVTSHMFGTGEFDSDSESLSKTLSELNKQGTDLIAGSFASPLKISFRKPISIDRPEFKIHEHPGPMSELPGWLIYGPDADHAGEISGIGHLGYDGSGRVSTRLKITEHQAIPHISIVTSDILGLTINPPSDDAGRFLANFPDLTHLLKNTKSMKMLLGSDGSAWAQKAISQGDIVLLLSDMYTGKANFSNTPIGSLPSGYIVATTLNSVLTGQWIVDRSDSFLIVAIFLFLGITCGTAPTLGWFALSFTIGTIIVPVLGLLSFSVMSVVFPWVASLIFFTSSAAMVFLKHTHARLMQTKERHAIIEKETEKLNAIVRTAQMFAHDVRKPFSMLNMTAQSIQKLTDTGQIIKFMNRMLPELERSMSSVEGMIQDIMEIDSMGSIVKENARVDDIIGDCLREVFLLKDTAEIDIEYRFLHSMMIDIDRQKIKRVIVNIVDNALQAMDNKGKIWIASCDVFEGGMSWVELTIGNSNSYIEPENVQRIFEAFYTKGKKGGTGLGLAIAQKVIIEHGGRITANSDKDKGTEFIFSLPAAHSTPESIDNTVLPTNAAAFLQFEASRIPEQVNIDQEKIHAEALEKLRAVVTRLNRKIKILVIDDELVYLESMKTILSGGVFQHLIDSETANSSNEALSKSQSFLADLILCDIDMGPHSISGFDIVERLRQDEIDAYIVMHSNRVFQLDSARAANVGANHFLPKPINEFKLINVILEGVKAEQVAQPDIDLASKKQGQTDQLYKDIVVVVDDDVFTLEAWETILDDAEIKTFDCPTAFWQYLAANKTFINDIKLIVTDYFFDNDAEEDGESFARKIKQIGNIPVVLSSNGSFVEVPDVFDATIGKEPGTYLSIKEKLNKVG